MSTDRELLELAAKAAGIALDGECPHGGFWVWDDEHLHHLPWNPLADDGDALRLAVKLDIQVHYSDFTGEALVRWRRADR